MTTEQTLDDIAPLIKDLIAAGCPPLPEWVWSVDNWEIAEHPYSSPAPWDQDDGPNSIHNSEAVLSAVTTWVMGEVVPWAHYEHMNPNEPYEPACPYYTVTRTFKGKWLLAPSPNRYSRNEEHASHIPAVLALLRALHGVVCGEVKA